MPPKPNPHDVNPAEGGRWMRDPETGALTRAPAEPGEQTGDEAPVAPVAPKRKER